MIVCKSNIVFDNLRRCKIELESIIKDESQGALIRSRFNMINKIDKGTTFFFNLEKKNGKSKQMTHLILDNGNVIDNPEVISQHVRDYYSDLFTPKLVVKEKQQVLLSCMKQLSDEQRIMCGEPITFKELTIAMNTLVINKSPGIDGFPVNFINIFGTL